MADDEPESAIDKLCRDKSLPLRAEGGRVFMHNADADNLDRCTIELKCRWWPSLLAMFDTSIRIGNDRHKAFEWDEDGVEVVDEEADEQVGWSLLDCPIMLSLYRVDEKWMAESAAKNEGRPILGRLNYYPPIHTADVHDERPSISVWAGIGRENFEFLRNQLVATEKPDFDLGITVEFPSGTVETGWVGSNVVWDGQGSLPVSGATIVWKRGDWDSKSPRERRAYREPKPEEYKPPREHAELLQSVNRVEAAMIKLAMPLWIAVGLLVITAVLAR